MTHNFVKTLISLAFIATLSACGGGGSDGGGGGGTTPPPDNTVKCTDNNASNKGYALPCICKSGYLPNESATGCIAQGGGDPGGGGAGAPANLFYPQTTLTAQNGKPFYGALGLSATVDNCVTEACTFTVAPAFPFNISINSSTGKISGTPGVLSARRNYIVTATNSKGSTTITLSLAVVPDAPAISAVSGGFDDDGDGLTEFYLQRSVNSGVINLTTVTSGVSSVADITLSPALPAGLTFEKIGSTGNYTGARITGTATAVMDLTTYTITAIPTAGNGYSPATRQFQLAVEAPPLGFVYNLSNVGNYCILNGSQAVECTFYQEVEFANIPAQLTSGNNLKFEIEQGISGYQNDLPSGISLNPNNGTIGTTFLGPMNEVSCGGTFCSYRVKVSNKVGAMTKELRIRVLPPLPPTNVSYGGPYTLRRAGAHADISATFPVGQMPSCHGFVGCYTISPTITDIQGVNWSSAYGRISVSPYVRSVKENTTYTVTVHVDTDPIAEGEQPLTTTFQLQAREAIPVFAYKYPEYVVTKGQSFSPIEIDYASIPDVHKLGDPNGLNMVLNIQSVNPGAGSAGLTFVTGPYMPLAPPTGGTFVPGTYGADRISPRTKYTVRGCYGGGAFVECSDVEVYLEVNPKLRGLTVGENHACAIEEGSGALEQPNRVLCWGLNDRGQLGHTSTDTCSGQPCSLQGRYVKIGANNLEYVSEVVAGKNHTCAIQSLKQDVTQGELGIGRGRVYCWGDNSNQQISNSASTTLTPTLVRYKSSARCADYQEEETNPEIACFPFSAGDNVLRATSLALGDGDTCFVAPGEVPAGTAICGANTTPGSCNGEDPYFLSRDVVHCLGRNYNSTVAANGFAAKIGISDANVNSSFFATGVGAGEDFACANTYQISFNINDPDSAAEINRERVSCWGKNDRGQLGRGTVDSNPFSVNVASVVIGGSIALTNVQSVPSTGGSFTCVNLKPDAPSSTGLNQQCWGANESGQLARNNFVDSSVAVQSFNFGQTSGIAKAADYVSYKKGRVVSQDDGKLHFAGALPLFAAPYSSATSSILSPLKLTASADVFSPRPEERILTKASMAENSMCYLSQETFNTSLVHFLRCWGHNENGQLGSGDTVNSTVPVRVQFKGN